MSRTKFEVLAANFNKSSCSSIVFISSMIRRELKKGDRFYPILPNTIHISCKYVHNSLKRK